MNDRIHFLSHADAHWGFDERSEPELILATEYPTPTPIRVDPFPCYAHEAELVRREVAHAEAMVPLPWLPKYFVIPFETRSRTNGWADCTKYRGQPLHPWILLQGKRIPIHPAMTRYLVSHEYGHVVHGNLAVKLGMKWEEFAEFYAREVRRIPYFKDYGAGKWHLNTGEIIANDIRITLLHREEEFWPHEVEHPLVCHGDRVRLWWEEVALPKLREPVEALVAEQ